MDIEQELKEPAIFSPCRKYRYTLRRWWGFTEYRPIVFLMHNPSTADEEHNDPTIRRCIGYAKKFGCSEVIILNRFSYRATNPNLLFMVDDPVGPRNDEYIKAVCDKIIKDDGKIIAAWGSPGAKTKKTIEMLDERAYAVMDLIPEMYYLQLTKDAIPSHPLYLKSSLYPRRWYSNLE